MSLSRVTVLALAAAVAASILRLALYLPWAYDTTYPEGAVVCGAWEVVQGGTPYSDWREWPHRIAPYPPPIYYLTAWTARLTGPVRVPADLYPAGRVVSFSLGLISLIMVCASARRVCPRDARFVFAAGALYLFWQTPFVFWASCRADAGQAAFGLAVLLIILSGRPKPRSITLTALLLAAAFWFKPVGWGVALVWAGWLVRGAGSRKAALILGFFALSNLVLLFIPDLLTGGHMTMNLLLAGSERLQPDLLIHHFRRQYADPPVVVFVWGGAALAFASNFIRGVSEARRTVLVGAQLVLVVAAVQSMKAGASTSYFIESLGWLALVWCTAAGAVAARVRERIPGIPARLFPALSLTFAVLMFARSAATLVVDYPRLRGAWMESDIQKTAAGAGGPVLTVQPALALASGSADTILDFSNYSYHFRAGRIDPRHLMQRIDRREFAMVIWNRAALKPDNPYLPPGFARAVRENYREVSGTATIAVYRPARAATASER